MSTLTQERLKELLHYDPETGVFTWRTSGSGKRANKLAGGYDAYGYICIAVDKVTYKASRLAWLYIEGYIPENLIDHKDRNPKNNKWKNLRHVTNQCNARNQSVRKNNKSGVTGVCWIKRSCKWQSQIRADRKTKYLGEFKTLKEAVQARWNAEIKYGYPNCNTTSSAYLYLQGVTP
jgi:hypothetical protein